MQHLDLAAKACLLYFVHTEVFGLFSDVLLLLFRTDGKSSVKMYTNPDYFMQLWFENLQKDVSETTKKHDGKKIKKVKITMWLYYIM